ncbi:MAG: diguanylate cyclase domain-containing protein [Gammaproteobacteria bacterium]
MRYLAHHDPLTGLPNRALFDDRIEQAIKHAARDNGKFAVLFFDLNRFKPVNRHSAPLITTH